MFTPQDRLIFSYFDGTLDTEGAPVTVYADPLDIDRAMAAALGGDVDTTVEMCREYETDDDGKLVLNDKGEPNRIQLPDVVYGAYVKLTGAIRKAFGLQAFDRYTGKGATTAMCIRVWNEYRAWVEKKDELAASSPTSSAASPGSP